MPEIQHRSIGENMRKVEIVAEEKAEQIKKIVERYNVSPWQNFTLDQLSVWTVWLTLAVSFFLFCTVSVVTLAVR